MATTRKRTSEAVPLKNQATLSKTRRTVEASVTMDVVMDSDSDSDNDNNSGSSGSGSDSSSGTELSSRGSSNRGNVAAAVLNTTSRGAKSAQTTNNTKSKSSSGGSSCGGSRGGSDSASGYTQVESKRASRQDKKYKGKGSEAVPAIPSERTGSSSSSSRRTVQASVAVEMYADGSGSGSDSDGDSRSSSASDVVSWKREVDAYSDVASTHSVNTFTSTAIDDERVIGYVLRYSTGGILSQLCSMRVAVARSLTPVFLTAALLCYALGGKENAQIGVVLLLVYLSALALAVVLGLPLVLLQRILASVSTGKSAELELLCLALSFLVMACVSITYNTLRGSRCGVLWCEGSDSV